MALAKDSESAKLNKFELEANSQNVKTGNDTVCDLSGGTVDLRYYESIFENNVKVSAEVVDSGSSVPSNDGNSSLVEVLDGLNIGGGEKINLEFEDNYQNKLSFSNQKSLYLNRLRNTIESYSKPKVFTLDLSPKEFFDNELTRVVRRYDGKISESVDKILKQVLKTQKKLDIDETENTYNFLGVTKKPFWTITWLAKKSIPMKSGKKNKTAGYLFFQTYDGFKYKSIDVLFDQEPKKKYIFNNTNKLPTGYDGKILTNPVFTTNIDIQEKLMMGAYNTVHKRFNFYDSKFDDKGLNYTEQKTKGGVKTAGREFNFVNEEFTTHPSRITYNIADIGGLPSGLTLDEQLKRSKEINLERQSITNQANMRYNQLGTIQVQVIIVGDFSLRAGDLIHCDFPELSSKPNQKESAKMSGIYMIADICHRITPSETLTSLNLIRDSYGKPNT